MNCGACGNACLAGQICVSGACENSCIAGLTLCSGACADLMRDPENCGSCGSRCLTGEVCYDGSCIAACPGGFTDCSGSCRDLDSDRYNCGACETECGEGEVCASGACGPTCASPLTNCSGTCADLRYDPDNCGTCGTACATAEACVAGTCEPVVLGTIGQARRVDGTWVDVVYQLCGSGTPGTCTAAAAKATCTGLGQRVISHAADTTSTEVYTLGATISCYWDISYYTILIDMPTDACLVAISNLDWSSCCTTSQWHGNTVAFGAAGAVFGYVRSGDSGYVSTYPNVSGTTWGCSTLTTAAVNRSGCTQQWVACTL
jgi:hypothetical protein